MMHRDIRVGLEAQHFHTLQHVMNLSASDVSLHGVLNDIECTFECVISLASYDCSYESVLHTH